MSLSTRMLLGVGLLLLASASIVGCVTTANNRRALVLVSEGKMHTLGAQAYSDMRKKEKRSTNRSVREIVIRVGKRIAQASGKKFQWEFEIFDAPTKVNAFCLPGGKIGVYTGLFPVALTEAGLAAVMGHEVAHATLRHGAQRVSQSMATNMGLKLAGALLGNSKYKGALMGALGLGIKFGVALPYSRKHESEADELGVMYMAKAGYDPRESVSLWQRMAKAGKSPPEIVSTHPDPLNRAKALRGMLSRVLPTYHQSQKQRGSRLPGI